MENLVKYQKVSKHYDHDCRYYQLEGKQLFIVNIIFSQTIFNRKTLYFNYFAD